VGRVVKVESGVFFFALVLGSCWLCWLISPGACCWDAHRVRCVLGSPFPRALFTPAFPAAARRSHLLAPALRAALGAEATSGLAPPFPRRSKTLSLACSPPRGPRDTDVQFAHLEY
jgi:hypothetical protein